MLNLGLSFSQNIFFAIHVKGSLFETSFTSITRTSVPACLSVRPSVCLLYQSQKLSHRYVGLYMARAVILRPLIRGTCVRFQANPCKISDGKSDTGTCFSPCTSLVLCRCNTTNNPCSFIHLSFTLFKHKELTTSLNNTSKWDIEHYIDRENVCDWRRCKDSQNSNCSVPIFTETERRNYKHLLQDSCALYPESDATIYG